MTFKNPIVQRFWDLLSIKPDELVTIDEHMVTAYVLVNDSDVCVTACNFHRNEFIAVSDMDGNDLAIVRDLDKAETTCDYCGCELKVSRESFYKQQSGESKIVCQDCEKLHFDFDD